MPPLTVTVPGPIVSSNPITFNISGTAPSEISEGYIMNIIFLDYAYIKLGEFNGDFCKLHKSGCPVKKDTAFDLQYEITAPNNLPRGYVVAVGILDPQRNATMCAAQVFIG